MGGKITKENAGTFLIAAFVRALKTAAQTAAALLSPALTGATVDLRYVGVISGIAGLYSLVTSLAAGLPEVTENGTLVIDTSVSGEGAYQLIPNGSFEELADMESVRLLVSKKSVGKSDTA